MQDQRFIEFSFPVKEVSGQGAKEKNIRHGHISTLHIWWARRPLATSRATNYAALIPAPKDIDEYNKKRNFIVELSKWENSLNHQIINQAREDILKANDGKPPKVLDPFGGGGAIPLEALRLGCEVYSNDYNPVAVLIQKCTLEFPQKYGKEKIKIKQKNGMFEEEVSKLVYDVEKWGNYVLEEAKKEIGKFYPNDENGSIPVGYIWARTIPCQNPTCGAEIPLMRQFWLAKKSNKKVSLYPYVEGKEVKFKIVGDGYEPMPQDFDSSKGTVSRAIATCPVCGGVVEADTTRKLFQEGKSGERLIAVVLYKEGETGKRYRVATEKDYQIFKEAEKYLEEKRRKLFEEWGIDPVPDEPLPPKETLGFRVQRYGILKWGQLFNSRQKLALITFTEKVKNAYKEMLKEGYEEEYAKAVVSYLGLAIDRIADKNSVLCRLISQTEAIGFTYGRQALPMLWDFIEMNVFQHSSGWYETVREILNNLKVLTQTTFFNDITPTITQSSATNLPYPEGFFDAVFTDPPYYDNVPYSYLSDFFYIWLKRSIGDLYPELFSTPLTPKSQELVAYSNIEGGFEAGKQFFENMLKKAFQEIHRVLRLNGIAVIVYAHKSTEGWETVINALLDSGLVITASYPLNTEMQSRLLASETAALSSSIYIVARKIKKERDGIYNDVKEELKNYLNKKLDLLWKEGISGADFFISAIGSAIEVFGKYRIIRDYEGNEIRADKLLEDIREIVINYAIKQILHNGISGQISPLTKFYLLYRYSYGQAKVHFDEARKLAQSIGIDLEKEWNKGFIKKEKEFIKVLSPTERKDYDDILKHLENADLIDILHLVLKLWEKGEKDGLLKILAETGYGQSEVFYKVAQAISETLPVESKEKKLLDGFLTGKERIISALKDGNIKGQKGLFE
ncbi:DUF1156 domain-containing protein [Persephonella sp.]